MNAVCSYDIGSFECVCNVGFSGDGAICKGMDGNYLVVIVVVVVIAEVVLVVVVILLVEITLTF